VADETPEHPLIKALVDDPAQPPQLLVLTGFLGRAADPAYQRIYLDLALSAFLDFAAEGIVHVVHTRSDEDPLSPSTVWIRQDTPIAQQAAPETYAADLMTGPLTRQFLPEAERGIPMPKPTTWPCVISGFVCPTTDCFPTPRCTLGSVCTATPKCPPSTPRCPPGPTSRFCTQGGPC